MEINSNLINQEYCLSFLTHCLAYALWKVWQD